MVEKENLVYLFIGQDIISQEGLSKKYAILKQIKEGSLASTVEEFNQDILYSKELGLKDLQERFLCLPVNSKRRLVIIKDAQDLKDDIKEFILGYVKKPKGNIILVLDMEYQDPRDPFVAALYKYAKISRFREISRLDTFALCRSIDQKSTEESLKILNQLLHNGEKPERILGGLRFAFERNAVSNIEIRKRLKSLLKCDIEIKTGKLKPVFALEKLVVSLCGFGKSLC